MLLLYFLAKHEIYRALRIDVGFFFRFSFFFFLPLLFNFIYYVALFYFTTFLRARARLSVHIAFIRTNGLWECNTQEKFSLWWGNVESGLIKGASSGKLVMEMNSVVQTARY